MNTVTLHELKKNQRRIVARVKGGETVTLTDVVGITFGKQDAYGVLNVRSAAPVIVTSNTQRQVKEMR